ncbi:hypothetical protein HD806DRAFT_504125 [Xylariaceae sp. AK1471]|nr:hypothetical protein HD806DRAFT_504125 [Xylariaceae sp. AK1471]
MASLAERPRISRKLSHGGFERLDHINANVVTVGWSKIGSVGIDVKLLLSKCKWGTLGEERDLAGVIYMDILIHQPPNAAELKNAKVLISLEESEDVEAEQDIPNEESRSSGELQFISFGPSSLSGGPIRKEVKGNEYLNGFGGLGIAPRYIECARWSFTGRCMSGNSRNGIRSWVYRTLSWNLEQNQFDTYQRLGSSIFHTGFALVRSKKPFNLKVEIKGTLHAIGNFPPSLLTFAPLRSRGKGWSVIQIDPSCMRQEPHRLDQTVAGLALAMEMENLNKLPVSKPQVELVGENKKLSLAAGNGYVEMIKSLLQDGAKPDQRDWEGRTPLSWAAGNGHLDVVKLLMLEKEVEIASTDKTGRTPLSWAAGNGCLNVVEHLLSRGTVSEKADEDGKTALAWAAQEGHEDIVQTFIQRYRGIDPGKKDDDARSEGLQITDAEIKIPLLLAAQNGHLPIMRMLVQARRETSPDSITWISRSLHDAIRDGRLSLVRLMFEFGASVDLRSEETERTPLCRAAEYGHADIIRFLLHSGAKLEEKTAEEETPLFLAAKNGKAEAVKVLLDAGADISSRNTKGASVTNAAVDYPTILRMISEKDRDGKLADKDPHPDVSHEFDAKVVFFSVSSGDIRTTSRGLPVSALLADPASIQAPESDETTFKWFHLPANNMQWVEVLISRYYDASSSAFQILKPERWVGRQHQGGANAHQARFMQPLCQAFGPVTPAISAAEEQILGDKDIVVFMPYLHWELNERLDKNKAVIKGGTGRKNDTTWTKYQKLLYAYLFKEDPHSLHLLHIRRTLDQFCYHTLSTTDKRDQDQTVTRYQQRFEEESKVTAMVDQLWMWVLVGAPGRADTIITCFPSKDGTEDPSEPDPDGFTDVFQNVMLYVLCEPQAVKTAYDLAGVIALSCSRVFLGPSRARKILQFSEVYESAISEIVNKETELFDMFRALTESRRKDPNPAEDILRILQKLANQYVDPIELGQKVQKYYNDTLSPEMPDADVVAALVSRRVPITDQVSEVLRKLGNFHVLDISREIALLREIKDIQDELDIMAMVFEDQMGVLKEMERIVRSIGKTTLNSRSKIMPESLPRRMQRVLYRADSESTDSNLANRSGTGTPRPIRPTPTMPNPEAEEHANIESKNIFSDAEDTPEIPDEIEEPTITARPDEDVILESQTLANYRQYIEEAQPASEIWGSSRDAQHSSLPLSTVQLSVGEIEKMAQRAAKANQALDFLVDLKQKQSNVMDARSARIQAEESFKLTKQAERQGKTIMVFTIVTIVFLPLSFLAAFFAINITQFRRDDKGTLGLGYVLEFMIPISAAVSFSFIYIAFKAERFWGLVSRIGSLTKARICV